MKKSKKLMILGLSLATGAVAATSTVSSFAWFSTNTKVTASQMQVRATTSKNLLISETETGGYAASITFTESKDAMNPVSTVKNTTPAFYKLKDVGGGYVTVTATAVSAGTTSQSGVNYYKLNDTSKDYEFYMAGDGTTACTDACVTLATSAAPATAAAASSTTAPLYYLYNSTNKNYVLLTCSKDARLMMEADSHQYAVNTTFEVATASDYATKTMYLMSTGSAATNLKADIEITGGGAEALDKSLRVMFVVTAIADGGTDAGTSTYIYAPKKESFSSYSPIASIDENGIPTTGEQINAVSKSGDVVIASLKADKAAKVVSYIWFEGQDTDCKVTNAVTLDTTTFKFSFYTE